MVCHLMFCIAYFIVYYAVSVLCTYSINKIKKILNMNEWLKQGIHYYNLFTLEIERELWIANETL